MQSAETVHVHLEVTILFDKTVIIITDTSEEIFQDFKKIKNTQDKKFYRNHKRILKKFEMECVTLISSFQSMSTCSKKIIFARKLFLSIGFSARKIYQMGYAFMLYNIHAQIVALQVTCDSEFEKHPPRLGIKP